MFRAGTSRGGGVSNVSPCLLLGAKLYAVPWEHKHTPSGHVGSSLFMHKAKQREGHLAVSAKWDSEVPLRQALQSFSNEPGSRRKLTSLPGVEFESELPADPVTRLFFQRKGDDALFEGQYDSPNLIDHDRVRLASRDKTYMGQKLDAVYDYCHRIREGSDQKKRFVVCSADQECVQISQVLHRHGLLAGFRDFNNKRAFAVELKYFQGDGVLNGIEPVCPDSEVEFEFTPKMMRRFMSSFGTTNKIRIFVIRTWDGRVIDHLDAVKEGIGGRGLIVAW